MLGIYILNEPFNPGNKELPSIYFSDDWYWEPGENLKPRREQWGGLLFALAFLFSYIGLIKKDIFNAIYKEPTHKNCLCIIFYNSKNNLSQSDFILWGSTFVLPFFCVCVRLYYYFFETFF